jgi:hypothetical protein
MRKTVYGIFLDELARYEDMLQKEKIGGAKYSTSTGTFFAALGFSVYSIDEKLKVVEKLKKHLSDDKQIFTERERGALQEGRLGEIFQAYSEGISLNFDQIIPSTSSDGVSCCPLVESPLFRL